MIEVPEKFRTDLKVAREIIASVNLTHPHLEGMMLMSMLADISNRAMLFIGVPDTGKSRVCAVIQDSSRRQVLNPHGITANGLKHYADRLNGSSTTVLVEDLSRSGTQYMQIQTVSVLAGLSYTGFMSKHNQTISLDLEKVKMSALIYAQPLILKHLVNVDEFDSDIRDKCPRYYHLFRPTDPFPKPLDLHVKYTSIDRKPVTGNGLDDRIIENLRHEVSKGRAIEHCQALVEGCARLNERDEITEADKWLVRGLTNNFKIETDIFRKIELEGVRTLNVNAIPVMTAFLSFKDNSLKTISQEFGVGSERRVRDIVSKMSDWVMLNSSHIYPTKLAKEVMKSISFAGDVP